MLLYKHTSVSWHATTLNALKMLASAILISSWASLMPTQLRGPAPNGRYAKGCRLALASGVNLRQKRGFNNMQTLQLLHFGITPKQDIIHKHGNIILKFVRFYLCKSLKRRTRAACPRWNLPYNYLMNLHKLFWKLSTDAFSKSKELSQLFPMLQSSRAKIGESVQTIHINVKCTGATWCSRYKRVRYANRDMQQK